MRIGVIGSGAIGCLVAGYLKLKGEDICLVGRPDSVKTIRENGLQISGVRGSFRVEIKASEQLNYIPELVILATKTQDIELAIKDNISLIRDALILTTQNGVQADNIVARYLPKESIVSSVVMFGATYLEPAKVVHNFEGSWIMGQSFNKRQPEGLLNLSQLLNNAFPTIITENIFGMKFLKIFANANNCLPAILGKSMQEVFSDLDISRISIAIWKEGLDIINKAGINLVSLPGFPIENITKITSMPMAQAAVVFSQIMKNLSKEPLYGSILQSIMRGRTSEIDYINGEFIRLAKENNVYAPLNSALVDMVHQVEKNNRFYSKLELIEKTQGVVELK
ncbi:MAG: 2-dehydropantoate 2-reductase [Candidatus Omnitrophica bacterium]|nr:2-dehydropantoate 2-reductase [Candidatus Omnitrophota bacterium]MBU1923253.1 2-dehydropantoate 2-reductase [Candidatus Omnitrophota bacterium]